MRSATAIVALLAATAIDARADGILPMPCDESVYEILVSSTDRDTLEITAAAGERFYVSILVASGTQNFNPRWQMIDTTGAVVGGPSSGRADTAPLVFSGTHWIEVYDLGSDGIGDYEIHLQRLTASSACEAIPLPCDTTIADEISDLNDNDLFTFTVTDTEMVWIAVNELDGGIFNAAWRILDASGAVVDAATSAVRGARGPYSSDGSPYRLHVFEWDHDAVGEYEVHLERLTSGARCGPTPLVCDAVATGSLATPIDSELFTFDVTGSEMVYVGVLEQSGSGFNAGWRVVDASGAEVWEGDPGIRDESGPFDAAGSPYAVHVYEWKRMPRAASSSTFSDSRTDSPATPLPSSATSSPPDR